MGGIQPIRLWRLGVMRVHGPNNAGRAVQTDPTLLRYASVITEQKNAVICLLKNLTNFKLCTKTPNNTQKHAAGCANGRSM